MFANGLRITKPPWLAKREICRAIEVPSYPEKLSKPAIYRPFSDTQWSNDASRPGRGAVKRHQRIAKTSHSPLTIRVNRVDFRGNLMPSLQPDLSATDARSDFARTGPLTDWRSKPLVSDDEC